MKKKFKIKGLGTDLYFWVYVYDNIKDLRKDAVKHGGEEVAEDTEGGKLMGIVHPYEKFYIDPEGKEPDERDNNIGIIRLSKKHLSTLLVSHEVIHAAMWYYRLYLGTDRMDGSSTNNADFGPQNSINEENFAHIYGQLFRSMTRKLYKHGYWK